MHLGSLPPVVLTLSYYASWLPPFIVAPPPLRPCLRPGSPPFPPCRLPPASVLASPTPVVLAPSLRPELPPSPVPAIHSRLGSWPPSIFPSCLSFSLRAGSPISAAAWMRAGTGGRCSQLCCSGSTLISEVVGS
eukprot:GHVU01218824.1.p1 GENE.GHVU01218824.1~~GHVU01218824.1.p1  ORF type:complete len:134 (+),score=4.01 GHVU01218824.1:678-1079(+)